MAEKYKIGQFTVKPLLERMPGQAAYVESVVAQLKALKIQKKPASTVQCASTQATLDRDPAKDEEHWNRPLPAEVVEKNKQLVEAYRAGDLSMLDKLVEARNISPEEFNIVEGLRRSFKNNLGQTSQSSASEYALRKAIDAFLYSPPAELTPEERKRISEMKPYAPLPESIPEVKAPKERGLAGNVLHFLWTKSFPSYWFTKKKLSVDVADNLSTHVKKTKPD